jgi:ribose transport system permease protein
MREDLSMATASSKRTFGFERFSGVYLLGVFIVLFSLLSPKVFFSSATLHSVAAGKSVLAILALAIVVPLIGGVYDLSVGANINFTTILVVTLISKGWSIPIAIIAGILAGAAIGLVNGFIVVVLKVNSFITTLGTASIISAFQVIVTHNRQPLPPRSTAWRAITQTKVLGFQIVVVYMLIIAAILWWALTHTPFGRYLYAIGGSPEAARLSGIKVGRYTWCSLVISGTLCGIAGVLYGSIAGPSLSFGGSLLLPAFAAVFLGSTQIKPGRFNVWGSVLAIFVLATGVKGLQLLTDVQWLDQMFSGVALVAAVAIAGGRQRSGDERRRKQLSAERSASQLSATPGLRSSEVPSRSQIKEYQ